jgi:DNA-binding HxlR family transcriptional regulator
MQNTQRRAHAGSSRALAEHAGAVEMAVILALSGNQRKDFSMLLRDLQPISQSVLAAAVVSLCTDAYCFRHPNNGRYCLTSRALDMLASAKRRGGRQARRAA